MTRLRQRERLVLDTLVESGVVKSHSEATVWCVRLVADHEEEWLHELRDALGSVREARAKGPGSSRAGWHDQDIRCADADPVRNCS